MKIEALGTSTFILLTGIEVESNVRLCGNVELQSADTSHLDLDTALATCSCADDIAVVAGCIPCVVSQLYITAETPNELAIMAWNSSWDALLLSAIFKT